MTTAQVEQQRLLIGGQWVGASSDRTFEKTDPYTGESAGSAAAATAQDAEAAADAAGEAFREWSTTPPGRRRELLQRAAGLLRERAEEIASGVTQETGGTLGWGMFKVGLGAGTPGEAP